MNIDNSMEFEQNCEGTRAMFEKEKKSRSRWFHRVEECVSSMFEETSDEEFARNMSETSKGYYNEDK